MCEVHFPCLTILFLPDWKLGNMIWFPGPHAARTTSREVSHNYIGSCPLDTQFDAERDSRQNMPQKVAEYYSASYLGSDATSS